MKLLVSLALALLVLSGLTAGEANAAPDEQYVIPYYSEWAAPLYESYYTPVYYTPAYYTPRYYRPYHRHHVPYTTWCRYC